MAVGYCFGFSILICIFFSHSLAVDESYKNNIKEIRSQVLKIGQTNSSLFRPDDVKYLMDDDWPILRFLIDTRNDKEKAQERVIKAFAFRNQELQANLDYFPAEIHRRRFLFNCGQSIAGRTLLQMKAKRVTHVDNLIRLVAKFDISIVDKVDRRAGQKGMDVVIDCDGYSIFLFEPKYIKTIVEWNEHFPVSPRNIFIYRFPWVYRTLWGLIKSLLNKQLTDAITFVDTASQLEQYVKFNQLDKDLGGTNNCPTEIPAGVESGICQSKFNDIKEEDWKMFYDEAEETFKNQAQTNGYKSVAEMFECKNNNSTANEIIKKVAENSWLRSLKFSNVARQLSYNKLL